MKVKSKILLEQDEQFVFGPGRVLILQAIAQTGSLKKAAEKLNMSYRRVWSYIHTSEERLGKQLLIKERGGRSGGGAFLTEYAKDLIKKFKQLEQEVKEFTDERYKKLFS